MNTKAGITTHQHESTPSAELQTRYLNVLFEHPIKNLIGKLAGVDFVVRP